MNKSIDTAEDKYSSAYNHVRNVTQDVDDHEMWSCNATRETLRAEGTLLQVIAEREDLTLEVLSDSSGHWKVLGYNIDTEEFPKLPEAVRHLCDLDYLDVIDYLGSPPGDIVCVYGPGELIESMEAGDL